MAMENLKEIREGIQDLKEKLSQEKKGIEKIDFLIGKKVDREPNLWEFSESELEQEIWNRFLSLEGKSNCLPQGEIRSDRKGIGWMIVLLKKVMRKLTHPYSSMLLERQNLLNRELLSLYFVHLLSLQKIKKRINAVEDLIRQVKKDQKDLFDELEFFRWKIEKEKSLRR